MPTSGVPYGRLSPSAAAISKGSLTILRERLSDQAAMATK
jgi:hypothetical protein